VAWNVGAKMTSLSQNKLNYPEFLPIHLYESKRGHPPQFKKLEIVPQVLCGMTDSSSNRNWVTDFCTVFRQVQQTSVF
jgi:hypothetical protein